MEVPGLVSRKSSRPAPNTSSWKPRRVDVRKAVVKKVSCHEILVMVRGLKGPKYPATGYGGFLHY